MVKVKVILFNAEILAKIKPYMFSGFEINKNIGV